MKPPSPAGSIISPTRDDVGKIFERRECAEAGATGAQSEAANVTITRIKRTGGNSRSPGSVAERGLGPSDDIKGMYNQKASAIFGSVFVSPLTEPLVQRDCQRATRALRRIGVVVSIVGDAAIWAYSN